MSRTKPAMRLRAYDYPLAVAPHGMAVLFLIT